VQNLPIPLNSKAPKMSKIRFLKRRVFERNLLRKMSDDAEVMRLFWTRKAFFLKKGRKKKEKSHRTTPKSGVSVLHLGAAVTRAGEKSAPSCCGAKTFFKKKEKKKRKKKKKVLPSPGIHGFCLG
jgi:hypothetical protein